MVGFFHFLSRFFVRARLLGCLAALYFDIARFVIITQTIDRYFLSGFGKKRRSYEIVFWIDNIGFY